MAKKKPRTPPPPRVQAPQRRTGSGKKGAPADDVGLRHRAVLFGLAGAGFVGLIIVVLVLALGGGKSGLPKQLGRDMATAGCTFKTVTAYVPKGEGTHVNSLTAKFPWNTTPPSNGQHYPEWAVWGFYTDPVNPRRVVHNEEHGGVVTWWGSKVPSSTVAKLLAFYQEQPTGSFGTPYPEPREQDRDHGVDRRPVALPAERLLRTGSHRDLPELHRGDEEGVRGLPQPVPRSRAGGDPAFRRRARHGPCHAMRLLLP